MQYREVTLFFMLVLIPATDTIISLNEYLKLYLYSTLVSTFMRANSTTKTKAKLQKINHVQSCAKYCTK